MKRELLENIEAARIMESETLLPHVGDSEPEAPGVWTVKDNVAHLTAWREVAAAELDVVLSEAAPPSVWSDEDAQNAKFYAEMRELGAADVIDRAARSWDGLAARVGACTEEQLRAPRPGRTDQQLWTALQGNGYGHLAEHIGYWHSARGDERGAEDVAIWARDLAAAVPDDMSHANGEYNLGCFYAKRGRADAALPCFARGIALRPELKEWARTDSDLDPIRSNPEVVRLLQG